MATNLGSCACCGSSTTVDSCDCLGPAIVSFALTNAGPNPMGFPDCVAQIIRTWTLNFDAANSGDVDPKYPLNPYCNLNWFECIEYNISLCDGTPSIGRVVAWLRVYIIPGTPGLTGPTFRYQLYIYHVNSTNCNVHNESVITFDNETGFTDVAYGKDVPTALSDDPCVVPFPVTLDKLGGLYSTDAPSTITVDAV